MADALDTCGVGEQEAADAEHRAQEAEEVRNRDLSPLT
jgi:predicted GTPase